MKIEFKNGSTIETIDRQDVQRGSRADFYHFLDGDGFWWKYNTKTKEMELLLFEVVDSQGV